MQTGFRDVKCVWQLFFLANFGELGAKLYLRPLEFSNSFSEMNMIATATRRNFLPLSPSP